MRAERTGRGPGKPHKIRCPHPTARLPLQTKEKLVDGAGLEPAATGLKGLETIRIVVIVIRYFGCRVEGQKDRSKITPMRRASETDALQGDGRAAGVVLNMRRADRAGTGPKLVDGPDRIRCTGRAPVGMHPSMSGHSIDSHALPSDGPADVPLAGDWDDGGGHTEPPQDCRYSSQARTPERPPIPHSPFRHRRNGRVMSC